MGSFIVLVLVTIHEMGHLIAAKALKLKITRVGFTLKPYPHAFVDVEWPTKIQQKLIYLFAGFAIIMVLFSVAYLNNFFWKPYLYYAFVFQLLFETNPFYSDFIIAIITQNKEHFFKNKYKPYQVVFKKLYLKHQFSLKWYIHLTLWTILFVVLIKHGNMHFPFLP